MSVEQAEAAGPPKPKLFISYSRTDGAAVDRLEAGMAERGFEILRDLEGIAFGEEWWARLVQMIGEADTILFMLTPRAAASPVCGKEVAEAHRRGKRIMPLLLEATDWNALPAALARINSFSLVGADDGVYRAKLDQLREALLIDLPWVREHSRIGAAAETWADGGRSPADLLAGTELRRALDWLGKVPPNAAKPTPLQREYIAASEAARHRRRVALLASFAAATILLLAMAAITQLYRLDARLGEARVALQNNDLAAAQQAMTDYGHDPVAWLFPATPTARQLASEILDRGAISGILRPGLRGDGRFEAAEVADNSLFLLRAGPVGPRLIRCNFALSGCVSRVLDPGWENATFLTDGTRLALKPAPPTEGFTSIVPVPTQPEAVTTSGTPTLLGPGSAGALAARTWPHEASFPISENPPPNAPLYRTKLECDDAGILCLATAQPPETTLAEADIYTWRRDDDGKVGWVDGGKLVPATGGANPAIGVSRDNSRAAVSIGRTLRIWDGRLLAADEEQEPLVVALPVEPQALRFAPDGSTLFILADAGVIRLNLDLRGARVARATNSVAPEAALAPLAAGYAWQADGRSIVRRSGNDVIRRRLSAGLVRLLADGASWGAASASDDGPFVFARADNGCPTDADGPTGADLILASSASAPPSLLLACAQGVEQSGVGLAIVPGGDGRFFIGAPGMAELIEWSPAEGMLAIHHIGAARSGATPFVTVDRPTLAPAGADGVVRFDLGRTTHAGAGMVGARFAPGVRRLALLDPTDLLIYDLDAARLTLLPSRVQTTEESFDVQRRGWLSRDGGIAVLATPSNAGPVFIEMFDAARARRLALPPGATAVRPRGAGRYLVTTASGNRCWSVPEVRGREVGLLERLLARPGRERAPIVC